MVGKGGSHQVTLLLERCERICSIISTDNDTDNNNVHTASSSMLFFGTELLSVCPLMFVNLASVQIK